MRNSIKTELQLLIFKNGSVINRLIAINIFFFLLLNFTHLFEWAAGSPSFPIESWLLKYSELPASFSEFLVRPWTLVTYMFIHQEFFHILFNMLWLYFIGKIFEEYLGDRKFTFVYIMGGLSGGVLFMLIYAALPPLHASLPFAVLIGASAGVMAIIAATATLLPNYSIGLMFIGAVPLKWIAIGYILLDLILIPTGNAGGHISHIGGAIMGFFYIVQLNKGWDWSGWWTRIMSRKPKNSLHVSYRASDTHTVKEKDTEQVINEILDKISKTGYKSLSEKEKQTLKKASQDYR